MGIKAQSETVKAFQGLAREVSVIGGCANPHNLNLKAAVHEAFNGAVEI